MSSKPKSNKTEPNEAEAFLEAVDAELGQAHAISHFGTSADISANELKQFYEEVLNWMAGGVWATDANDVIIYANRGLSSTVNTPVEEVVGLRVEDGIGANWMQPLIPLYAEAKAKQQPVSYADITVTAEDGPTAYYSGWFVPRVRDGRFTGMISTIEDTTQRKLDDEEQARLIESMEEQNRIISASQIELEQAMEKLEQANVDMEIHSHELEAANDELLDTQAKLLDANQLLQDSEERLLAITTAARDAIIMIDSNSNVTFWNNAAERMFGYPTEDAVGKNLNDLLAPEALREEYWATFTEPFTRGLSTRASTTVELHAVTRDGDHIPIEVSLSFLKMKNEWHLLSIMRDVTERKQSEEGLRQAKDEAEAANLQLEMAIEHANEMAVQAELANSAKSQFLASMSHEIRTPMNAILGMAELLSETDLTSEQEQYVRTFQTAGENLLEIINDILDISKIEAGHLELEQANFDLRELLDHLGDVLAVRAHGKGIELGHYIAPDLPTKLIGDPTRLRQIVTNLVGNAIKFTHEGGVYVEVRPENGAPADGPGEEVVIHCAVSDTGIGIPPDKLETVFDVFTQVDTSTTRRYGGTGLGLSISKQLVELMGGRVWVESRVGEGSTFHFTARLGVQTHPCSVPADEPTTLNLKGVKVLVVDDTPTNRLILNRTLTRLGALVTEAADGERGILELKRAKDASDPYALILIDNRMPGMDGFMMMETMQRQFGVDGATIMMLTSDNRVGDADRAKALGITCCLTKPVKRQDLLDAIASSMGEVMVREKPKREACEAEAPEDLPPLRILLVEDNVDNQKLVGAFLKKTPYTLELAENGEEALDRFKASQYDLVLMDVQMPVMDGYTATQQIRAWEQEQGKEPTPVIALTAHATAEDEQKSLRAGCDGHLTKPIKKARLLESIREYAVERQK